MDSSARVVFVGPTGVGKTSLITRAMNPDASIETVTSTAGSTFDQLKVNTPDGEIALNLYDTAGQETYLSLTPMYARNADAVVFVCDLTRLLSLDSETGVTMYLKIVSDVCPEAVRVLVGNKSDYPSDELQIPMQQLIDYAAIHDFNQSYVVMTSAKTGENVNALFHSLAHYLLKNPVEHNTVQPPKPAPKKTSCC